MRPFTAVALAMGADLVTFAIIVPIVGIGAESNHFMLAAYLGFGIAMVAAIKVLATAVILYLMTRFHRDDLRRAAAVVGVAIGLLGAVGNISAALR